MRDYSFNVQLAQTYGLDEAVFIHSLEFWIRKNRANGRHFHDGRWWTYNSISALAELFPFWTRRQLERIISSCKSKGILYTGDYNSDRQKRTVWYALDDIIFEIYGDEECISRNGEMPQNEPEAFPQTVPSISPNGEMYYIEPVSIHTVSTPIPPEGAGVQESKSSPKSAPKWKPERFEKFWAFYPRGEAKKSAIRAWDKLRPPDELIDKMATALVSQMESEDWRRGIGIPYASTWLNGRRWEDLKKEAEKDESAAAGSSDLEVFPEWT